MLHRFYQPAVSIQDDTIILKDHAIAKQITSVLRFQPGDTFVIFTPTNEYTVSFVSADSQSVTAHITNASQPDRNPARRLILYQALLKKDNFELVLQKCTELGVHAFVPIITERTIIRKISDNKLKRYHKILTEATEQCGGTHTPELSEAASLSQLAQDMPHLPGTTLVADESETASSLSHIISGKPEPIRLIVGPEGGFAPGEIDQLKKSGARSVQLGPRILRAETAAIAASSIILLSE